MYSIHMVGREVTVKTPNGAEYHFSGYGDYDMEFDQNDLRRVCHVMFVSRVVRTNSTLTDAVLTVRNQKQLS